MGVLLPFHFTGHLGGHLLKPTTINTFAPTFPYTLSFGSLEYVFMFQFLVNFFLQRTIQNKQLKLIEYK